MMNRRDVYSNGPRAYAPKESGNILISTTRFQPRSQPALRRRKQLLTRLGIALGVTCLILFICFPSFRGSVLAAFPLSAFSGIEELQLETVRYYDLSNSAGTARGWEREERVLMCAPLRDAEAHLPMFFSHLRNFTYPHHLIDLAFLVSDSQDNTLNLLSRLLTELQSDPDPKQPYGEISVIEKDFGQQVNQDVESRHGFAAQASRRKLMAQARNWLLSAALRPTHSWVYWRDVDVETAPFTILEDLMRHNKDIIVPNVWRPLPDWLGGEQPYDLNSWQESETALALADTLDEDAVIVEGYAEYATWRPHLAYLRDPYGDPDMEMEIDGVGGVSILAKASVFRAGVHFPAFSFEKHAETEGFGKMAKRMKFSVVGLPHYTVWHLYEPSVDDIQRMEEMEQERKNRENEEKERADRAKKIKEEFSDGGAQWEKDKSVIGDLSQKEDQIRKEHDAAVATQEKGASTDGSKAAKADAKSPGEATVQDSAKAGEAKKPDEKESQGSSKEDGSKAGSSTPGDKSDGASKDSTSLKSSDSKVESPKKASEDDDKAVKAKDVGSSNDKADSSQSSEDTSANQEPLKGSDKVDTDGKAGAVSNTAKDTSGSLSASDAKDQQPKKASGDSDASSAESKSDLKREKQAADRAGSKEP